jgi:protein-S-isoprenylcysteine O-methyltransferase Ste14
MSNSRKFARDVWCWLLAYDNQLFGAAVAPIALYTWYKLFCRAEDYAIYFANDIYAVPALSLLTIFLSAMYLTVTSVILLKANDPVARYSTLLPNLLSVPAAFGVYAFSLTAPSETRVVPVYVALILLASGAGLVLVTLFHLRRAFTVTPQARTVVQSGPYGYVRHPMYVGNILTMFGLALLIGTPAAFLIAAFNCVLQVFRGSYEDRLLSATFPEYGVYMTKVCAFFPCLGRRKQILATLAVGICVGLGTQNPVTAAEAALGRLKSQNLLISVADSDAPSICKAWLDKALSGQWYNEKDIATFYNLDQSEEAAQKAAACKEFFALQDKCQSFAVDRGDESSDKMKILGVVESTPGCKSIIGADIVCRSLEFATKKGKKLSPNLKAILPVCLDKSILANTSSFLRLGE